MSDLVDPSALAQLRELQDEDDPHMARDLVAMFVTAFPEKLATMQRAAAAADAKTLTLVSHTLKSNAANLGALVLRDLFLAIETAASAGRFDEAQVSLAGVEAVFSRTREELERLLKQ